MIATTKATPTRRRWFQFSLGTMFLVVIGVAILASLAIDLNFVRERKKVGSELYRSGMGSLLYFAVAEEQKIPLLTIPNVPFWRRWLGDDAVVTVLLHPHVTPEERDRISALFPEANMIHERVPNERHFDASVPNDPSMPNQ